MFTAKILPPGKSLIDKDLRSLIVDTILSEGGDVTTGNYSGKLFRAKKSRDHNDETIWSHDLTKIEF